MPDSLSNISVFMIGGIADSLNAYVFGYPNGYDDEVTIELTAHPTTSLSAVARQGLSVDAIASQTVTKESTVHKTVTINTEA